LTLAQIDFYKNDPNIKYTENDVFYFKKFLKKKQILSIL